MFARKIVAITTGGLFVKLMGIADGLIPWSAVATATVKPNPEDRSDSRMASVTLKERAKTISIGGAQRVFTRQSDVERFVEQVCERIHSVGADEV